jgi:hypothetical protein
MVALGAVPSLTVPFTSTASLVSSTSTEAGVEAVFSGDLGLWEIFALGIDAEVVVSCVVDLLSNL